jgi:hypothetical protein
MVPNFHFTFGDAASDRTVMENVDDLLFAMPSELEIRISPKNNHNNWKDI